MSFDKVSIVRAIISFSRAIHGILDCIRMAIRLQVAAISLSFYSMTVHTAIRIYTHVFILYMTDCVDEQKMRGKQIHLDFVVRIVNSDRNRHFQRDLKQTFPIPGAVQGWGEKKFIETQQLTQLGYVANDTLTIEVRNPLAYLLIILVSSPLIIW